MPSPNMASCLICFFIHLSKASQVGFTHGQILDKEGPEKLRGNIRKVSSRSLSDLGRIGCKRV
jgi:hypothetical protein